MNLTKVISSSIVAGKRMIKFLRMGKSDVREKPQVGPYGFDSCPIPDRIAVYSDTGEQGKSIVIGYINLNQLVNPGESRLYSEDENGNLKFYLWLKNNGTAEFGGTDDNLVRFIPMEQAFDEVNDKLNDMISKWNAFAAAYVPGSPTTVGLPSTLAGQNVSPSTADISGAKINEIKTL